MAWLWVVLAMGVLLVLSAFSFGELGILLACYAIAIGILYLIIKNRYK